MTAEARVSKLRVTGHDAPVRRGKTAWRVGSDRRTAAAFGLAALASVAIGCSSRADAAVAASGPREVCVTYAKAKVGDHKNPFIVKSDQTAPDRPRVVSIDMTGKVTVARSGDARKVIGIRPAQYMAFQLQTTDGKALKIDSLILKYYPLKAGEMWISIQDGNGGYLAEADVTLTPSSSIQEARLQVGDPAKSGIVLALAGANVLFPTLCFHATGETAAGTTDLGAIARQRRR